VLLRSVYPLMAIAALVLLRRGGRLNVAGALVLMPTGIAWLYWIVLFFWSVLYLVLIGIPD
jgi:hypothetical protein